MWTASLLAALLFMSIGCMPESFDAVKTRRTQKDLCFLSMQLEIFKSAHHAYPRVAGIRQLQEALGQRLLPHDAWGTPYRYECSGDGRHYRLISAGTDQVFSPDIGSWKSAHPNQEVSDDIVWSDGDTCHSGSHKWVWPTLFASRSF